MCGIFSIINHQSEYLCEDIVRTSFQCGEYRGPEYSSINFYDKWNSIIGFHRLAINGLNEESNQPIIIDDIALICNGEIYNYKKLYEIMDIIPKTQSDCEVIIHLYKKYGIDQTLRMLDGVFAFVLYTPTSFIIARDPYGVRPLYYLDYYSQEIYMVASELKSLINLCSLAETESQIQQFKPGHYLEIRYLNKTTLLTRENQISYFE